MKNIYSFIAVSAIAVVSLLSCDKQDDTYRQYIVPGGYNYPAKASQVVAKAGFHRVDVSWAAPLDPAVKTVKIYWDNYRDSASVSYADAKDGVVTAHVPDLEERSYTFNIVNFDDKGNRSLASEITMSPYGEGWLSTHAERRLISSVQKGDSAAIVLGPAFDEMVLTKFRYKDISGNVVESEPVSADSLEVFLQNSLQGKYFEYKSAYCPKNGLDVIWNENWSKSPTPILYNLANAGWKVTVTNKQFRSEDYSPANMFDHDLETRYYSSTNTTIRKNFPKVVAINTMMSGDQRPVVSAVNVIQHPTEAKSRLVKAFAFYVGDTEYDPDDSNYLESYGIPALDASLRQDEASQQFNFDSVTGSCFSVVFKSSYSSYGYVDVFEFEVLGFIPSEAN